MIYSEPLQCQQIVTASSNPRRNGWRCRQYGKRTADGRVLCYYHTPERGQCEETYRTARFILSGSVTCGDRCPKSGPRGEDGLFLCPRHARLRREWSQPGAACSLDRSRFVPKRHGKRLPVDVRDAYLAEMRAVCLRYNISPDPATWSLDVRRELRRRHATPTDLARKHGVSIPRAHELLREMALMPLVCQHPLVKPRRGRPHCAYRVVGIAADDPAAPRLVCSYHQRQYAQVAPLRQVVVSLPQQGRELLEVAA